jgi:hypothetical protein
MNTQKDKIKQWTLYCNIQALVHKIIKVVNEDDISPEAMDSDITEQIVRTKLPDGQFKHVKGHQTIISNIPESMCRLGCNISTNKLSTKQSL